MRGLGFRVYRVHPLPYNSSSIPKLDMYMGTTCTVTPNPKYPIIGYLDPEGYSSRAKAINQHSAEERLTGKTPGRVLQGLGFGVQGLGFRVEV